MPAKWWKVSPTSSATSRKSGIDEGLANAVVPGMPIRPIRPEDSKCKKRRRPKMPLSSSLDECLAGSRFFLFTVTLSVVRECEDRDQCWQSIRTDRAPQHDRAPGGYSARQPCGRPSVRTPCQARTCIEGCFHPLVRSPFLGLEFLRRTFPCSLLLARASLVLAGGWVWSRWCFVS